MSSRATVWAARLGTLDEGVRGVLELGAEALSFAAEDTDLEIRIPFSEIRSARRSFGSPVMVILHEGGAVAFYFVEPPPLVFAGETSRRPRKRMRSIAYLQGRNQTKRREVKEWVGRVGEEVRRARGL